MGMGLEKVQKGFKYLMSTIVFFWIILECVVVFSRYVLKVSIVWSDEMFTLVFVWLIFIGCAMASVDDKHIEISILTDALHGKTKLILKVLQNVLMGIFIAVLLVQSVNITALQMKTGQFTAILNWPVWYTTLAMVVGSAAWMVVMVWKTVLLIKKITSMKGEIQND